jgi:putative ABC transport system ATP-binding protein
VQSEAAPKLLNLRSVRFGWDSDSPVLDIEHLTVDAGESVMIAGPSGSGKSTLLALLAGVAVADAGRVEVLGHDLDAMSASSRDKYRVDEVGLVFQQFNLVPYLSALENVLLPCRFSRKRRHRIQTAGSTPQAEANRLLTALELDQRTISGRTANKLSLGQQQRVAVARALIGNPPLLIADEPTSALDEDMRKRFLDLLFAQCESNGTTLIFVSHDQRLAPLFDRTIQLSDINEVSSRMESAQ